MHNRADCRDFASDQNSPIKGRIYGENKRGAYAGTHKRARRFGSGKRGGAISGAPQNHKEKERERQADPEEAIQEQTTKTDFRQTMADNTHLSRLIQEHAARRAARQAGTPSTELGNPAWPPTGTGATGPTPAGGAIHAPSAQVYTPHGGTGFTPWNIGPAGHMMPPTGQATQYGTPCHGQQWPYAQNYPGTPGFYQQQYQLPAGYFPGQIQPLPEAGGLGNQLPSGYFPGQPQPLSEVGGLGNRTYGASTSVRPSTEASGYLPGQPQPLGEIGGLGNRPYGAPIPSDLPRRIMRTGLLPHTFPRSTSPRGWGNSVHAKSHRGYSAKRTGKNGNGSKSIFLFYIRNRFRNNENGSASTHVP